MSLDQNVLDGLLEITIPVEEVRYRSADGDLKRGLVFKGHLVVRFADGTDAIIQNPMNNLEFHDHTLGHGLMVFKLEQVARDQGDGVVVYDDSSNV